MTEQKQNDDRVLALEYVAQCAASVAHAIETNRGFRPEHDMHYLDALVEAVRVMKAGHGRAYATGLAKLIAGYRDAPHTPEPVPVETTSASPEPDEADEPVSPPARWMTEPVSPRKADVASWIAAQLDDTDQRGSVCVAEADGQVVTLELCGRTYRCTVSIPRQ